VVQLLGAPLNLRVVSNFAPVGVTPTVAVQKPAKQGPAKPGSQPKAVNQVPEIKALKSNLKKKQAEVSSAASLDPSGRLPEDHKLILERNTLLNELIGLKTRSSRLPSEKKPPSDTDGTIPSKISTEKGSEGDPEETSVILPESGSGC
jgi:hypothetical protein